MDSVLYMAPPLRGIWKAIKSPGHHQFAYDFAAANTTGQLFAVSTWRLMLGKGTVENAYSWAQPVYAPLNGTVVTASDGWTDRRTLHLAWDALNLSVMSMLQAQKMRDDLRIFAGNHIIIASAGCYVLLAHLRNGSLRVAPDQPVACGQPIATVGNSGNSLAPHLHLQVNDGTDLLGSAIQPFAFTRYERWTGQAWQTNLGAPPHKGDLLRFDGGHVGCLT